jgi:hypothetical protein
MLELFYQGGALFMGILTLLFLIIVTVAVYRVVQISRGDIEHFTTFRHSLGQIKSIGLFTLVFGIFAQLLGLYQMFSFIQQSGDVAPSIVAGGLKVSTISTLYGMIIFLLSWLIWLGLDYRMKNAEL